MPVLKLLPKAVLLVDDVVKPVAPKIVKTVARPRPPLITSTSPAPAPPAGPRPYDVVLGGRRPPSPVTEAGPRPYDVVLGGRRPTGFRPFPTQPTPSPPRPPSPLNQALNLSQQTGAAINQVNQNLLDFALPGLNEVSDFLAEAASQGIQDLLNLGEQQEERTPEIEIPEVPQFEFDEEYNGPNPWEASGLTPPNLPGASWEVPIAGLTGWTEISYTAESLTSVIGSWVPHPPGQDPTFWTFNFGEATETIEILNPIGFGFNFSGYGGYWYIVGNGISRNRWQTYPQPRIISLPLGFTGVFFSIPEQRWLVDHTIALKWDGPSGYILTGINFPQPIELASPPPIRISAPTNDPNEGEDVTCDLSAIQSILRRQQQILNGLQANVSNANLAINANIDTLKPPINQINATTQTISAKADDLASGLTNVRDIASATNTNVTNVANTVNSTASKVDDLASGLNNVRDIARNTADKVDSVADAVNGMGNNINNIGNRVNDIWNKLGEVGNKIGENFTKTMERFDKLAKWLKLPMIFDALSLILLLHNAAMLSSNLVQTLGQIIDVGLDVIGLKDENGESFDVAQILGQQANNFMKSILGEANWTQTTTTWKRLSNIYQAAANVIYSVQSIVDSTRSIMELGAEMTGKIGNALRKAGVVFENAFNWFPEQINAATARQTKLNGMIQGIQGVDETASSLSSAISEVKNIQDTVIEMREQRQKFDAAVSELVTGKTTEESETKAKSQSPPIQPPNSP